VQYLAGSTTHTSLDGLWQAQGPRPRL